MVKTNKVGQFIQDARLRAGFPKQEALAQALHCTGQYIHLLETGKTIPSVRTSAKIQTVLRIDANKLIVLVIDFKVNQKIQALMRECEDCGIQLSRYANRDISRHLLEAVREQNGGVSQKTL